MQDTAILSGHLSGLEKWVPNLSVKLYPADDHWVMLAKGKQIAQDIRPLHRRQELSKGVGLPGRREVALRASVS